MLTYADKCWLVVRRYIPADIRSLLVPVGGRTCSSWWGGFFFSAFGCSLFWGFWRLGADVGMQLMGATVVCAVTRTGFLGYGFGARFRVLLLALWSHFMVPVIPVGCYWGIGFGTWCCLRGAAYGWDFAFNGLNKFFFTKKLSMEWYWFFPVLSNESWWLIVQLSLPILRRNRLTTLIFVPYRTFSLINRSKLLLLRIGNTLIRLFTLIKITGLSFLAWQN